MNARGTKRAALNAVEVPFYLNEMAKLFADRLQILETKLENIHDNISLASTMQQSETRIAQTESRLTDCENKLNEMTTRLAQTESKLNETNARITQTESKITQIINEITPIITSHANALNALLGHNTK